MPLEGRHPLPVASKVSASCKKDEHTSCFVLKCNCDCHKRGQ